MAPTDAKQERQLAVVRMLKDGLTYAEIGRRLGVSKQRVQQLIADPSYVRDARRISRNNRRLRLVGV